MDEFDAAGNHLSGFTCSSFSYPYWLAVDSAGDIYVADESAAMPSWDGKIFKFAPDGQLKTSWNMPNAGTAEGIGIDEAAGLIYVSDWYRNRVDVFDLSGTLLTTFNGTEPGGPGEMYSPMGLTVGPDGAVYVSDYGTHSVQAYVPGPSQMITASAGAGGAIAPAGQVVVPRSGDKAFTITPDADYRVDDIRVDGESVLSDMTDNGDGSYTYSFTNVQVDHVIAASFGPQLLAADVTTAPATTASGWTTSSDVALMWQALGPATHFDRGDSTAVGATADRVLVADGSGGVTIYNTVDGAHPTYVSAFTTGYPDWGVDVSGDTAFVTDGHLWAYDIGDPSSPIQLLSMWPSSGFDGYWAARVVIDGHYAYLYCSGPAPGGQSLVIADIADPTSPVLLGHCELPYYSAESYVVSGDHVYLAAYGKGVTVVDVSDKDNPHVADAEPGQFQSGSDGSMAVDATGGRLFVANGWGGLCIYDVAADPVHPPLIRQYLPADRGVRSVGVDGDTAVLGLWGTPGACEVLDVADPSYPMSLGRVDASGSGWAFTDVTNVRVAGGYACALDGANGTAFIPIGSPMRYEAILDGGGPGERTVQGTSRSAVLNSLSDGSHQVSLRVADEAGTWSNVVTRALKIDTHAPVTTVTASGTNGENGFFVGGSVTVALDATDNGASGIAGTTYYLDRNDSVTYTAPITLDAPGDGSNDGTHVIWAGSTDNAGNVEDTSIPSIIAIDTQAPEVDSIASSTHPDEATWYPSHSPTFDWSVPDARVQGTVATGAADSYGVTAAGDFAYLGADPNQIDVIDVSSPDAPRKVGGIATRGTAECMQVVGDLLYACAGEYGLQILDLHGAADPTLKGECAISGSYASGVAVGGDHAYVAGNGGGLASIDVSDPAHPTLLGTTATMGDARWAVVRGDYLYVVSWDADHGGGPKDGGLQVFDIGSAENRDHPVLLSTLAVDQNIWGLDVAGGYAYVACAEWDPSGGFRGVKIIDVHDPSNPTYVSSWNDPHNWPESVQAVGDRVYVADWEGGVQVLDVSDRAHPTRLTFCPTSGARGIWVDGDHAYVADRGSRLTVVQLDHPRASWWIDQNASPTTIPGDAQTGRATSAS